MAGRTIGVIIEPYVETEEDFESHAESQVILYC